jgi:hypothetical protein
MKTIIPIICGLLLIASYGHAEQADSVESRYGNVVIPHLAISNSTLMKAIEQTIQACTHHSPSETAPGIVVNLNGVGNGDIGNRRINLVTNNVQILDAIRAIAIQANLTMVVETNAIFLKADTNQ